MVLEIVGTRLLAPVFGGSLLVWASQIAVTLAALSLGYYAGGLLADRRPGGEGIDAVIFGAGALTALGVFGAPAIMRVSLGLGLAPGAFAASSLIFGTSVLYKTVRSSYMIACMTDQRLKDYARLLVETCVDVQPGWQVLVVGSPLARPLLEEVTSQVAHKGAYALVRQSILASRV